MKCTKCQEEKPKSEYYSSNGKRKRIYKECKPCWRKRMNVRNHEKRTTLVKEAGGKCTYCGYSRNIRVLNFHHINPKIKEFEISDRWSSSLERLRGEAKKCILLCANCHGEEHYA